MAKKVEPFGSEGMGSMPHKNGTGFRVWAPNAKKVYLTGDFNEWKKSTLPMAKEENGYWSLNVEHAEPGHEYLYIIYYKGKEYVRNDPYAKVLSKADENSIIFAEYYDWSEDDFHMPPHNELVMYQLHIGTFNASSPENPGTFESAIKKLDHLQELGINAIELMPVNETPNKHSWGYDLIHLYAINKYYGGPNGLKNFIKEAHKRGIAVILDVIYNHIGPIDHDLWRFDGWAEGDFGGIYFYNDDRCETPWGHTRFNYEHPEVRRYILDNVMMLLDEYRNDGLRWDGTAFIRNVKGTIGDPETDLPEGWSLMAWLNDEIKKKFDFKISIAEDLKGEKLICKPSDEGGLGFHAQWEPGFSYPLRELLIAENDDDRDMEKLKELLEYPEDLDYFNRVIFSESHDTVANGMKRITEEIAPDDVNNWFAKKKATLGVAMVMTAPGIPMIFQGQELLEDKWFDVKDPIDWNRRNEFEGIFKMLQDMISLRLNKSGTTNGLKGSGFKIYHLNKEGKVIAFHRWFEGGAKDDVVVVANFSNTNHENYRVGFPNGGSWKVRFNSDAKAYDKDFGDKEVFDVEAEENEHDEGLTHSAEITIPAYTAIIFSQDE